MINLIKRIDKKSWLIIICIFFLVWAQVGLDLKIPDYMSEITKSTKAVDGGVDTIVHFAYLMMACALGSLLIAIIVGYLVSLFTATFSMNTRAELYRKVQALAQEDIHKFNTASLITRSGNDISQVEMMFGMGLQSIFQAPIMAIWAMKKVLTKNWQWTLATGVAIFILMALIALLIIIVLPKFSLVQKLIDKLNGVTRENLTGIRVIRAFNAEDYQLEKFDKVNKELTETQLFNQRAFAMLEPAIYLVMFFLSLTIFYVGAVLINDADPSNKVFLFGEMVVFSAYAMQIIFSFLTMAFILVIVSRAQVSADRINEVLVAEERIKDGKLAEVDPQDVVVEFRNVSFQYLDAKEKVVRDISFKARRGETVAFVGSTGSGKSSLINLIPRFADVTSGEILIDGVNVKDYKLEALRNKIGYVAQKPVIFDMTVLENVKYGRTAHGPVSDDMAIRAIEIAQAKAFVERLEDGYKTRISRGGTNLSGGQKQRLSIARAIARSPEIYIFDDSFSALDNMTDLNLRKSLNEYTKDSTKFIVATRIGTIIDADLIIVLQEGMAVGMGRHEDLMKTCETYRDIANSQLPEEELYEE